jgi:hypothetical protein
MTGMFFSEVTAAQQAVCESVHYRAAETTVPATYFTLLAYMYTL